MQKGGGSPSKSAHQNTGTRKVKIMGPTIPTSDKPSKTATKVEIKYSQNCLITNMQTCFLFENRCRQRAGGKDQHRLFAGRCGLQDNFFLFLTHADVRRTNKRAPSKGPAGQYDTISCPNDNNYDLWQPHGPRHHQRRRSADN